MPVTIDLSPDIEAGLAALAREQGLPLPEYLSHLLGEPVSSHAEPALSPARRADMWREAVRGLPDTTPLSDEAISRESIYGSRG